MVHLSNDACDDENERMRTMRKVGIEAHSCFLTIELQFSASSSFLEAFVLNLNFCLSNDGRNRKIYNMPWGVLVQLKKMPSIVPRQRLVQPWSTSVNSNENVFKQSSNCGSWIFQYLASLSGVDKSRTWSQLGKERFAVQWQLWTSKSNHFSEYKEECLDLAYMEC